MSRIDYKQYNYCSKCEEKRPIERSRCHECGNILRTRPLSTTERRRARTLREREAMQGILS